jgi:hypothetical protein
MKPNLIDYRRFYVRTMSDVVLYLIRRFWIQYPTETIGSFCRISAVWPANAQLCVLV